MQTVRDSARLLVQHDQRHEGDEIEQEPAASPEHEGGSEQHQDVAVGRQREPEREHLGEQGDRERDRGEHGGGAVDVAARWPPALAVAAAMALAVLVRAPFFGMPLTADEGGYAEVARLWSRGAGLYQGAWVDRPQGLLLVFRAMLHVDGGSAEALRALAAVAAALVVALTMVVTARLAGRIPATIAGLAMATVGASPVH